MSTTTETSKRFPVGGPRQPVYDFMRGMGFAMEAFGDKHWSSADGLAVRIYGAGSMAMVYLNEKKAFDCALDDLAGHIEALRLNAKQRP